MPVIRPVGTTHEERIRDVPERIEITGWAYRVPIDLLGRHVERCSDRRRLLPTKRIVSHHFSDAEVEDLQSW